MCMRGSMYLDFLWRLFCTTIRLIFINIRLFAHKCSLFYTNRRLFLHEYTSLLHEYTSLLRAHHLTVRKGVDVLGFPALYPQTGAREGSGWRSAAEQGGNKMHKCVPIHTRETLFHARIRKWVTIHTHTWDAHMGYSNGILKWDT